MKQKTITQRMLSALLAALVLVTALLPLAVPAAAANEQFITDIRLAAGSGAVDKLEADGYSVMLTGLNMTYEARKQVYLGYKINEGKPITNIIITSDAGASITGTDGFEYTRASQVDVDQGIGGGSGCVYFTRESKAGKPLVGIDVLRSDDEVLYPITNDGAQIVRTLKGTPADLESVSKTAVVYLAQIRDGIVCPYISEVGVVTDKDKWNAVYTACERGYNYYVDGDIDDEKDSYTMLVYKRTADVKEAVTSVTAVSQKALEAMVEQQVADKAVKTSEKLTGAAISISGTEYVRVSGKAIEAKEPYYLYQTKNTAAGNPVSMLYAEKQESEQNLLFGTWVNAYFSAQGNTSAYAFCANEDNYSTLREDLTVMTKLPVSLFASFPNMNQVEPETTTEAVSEATTEQFTEVETEPVSETVEQGEEASDTQEASEASTEAVTEVTTQATTQATTQVTTEPTTQAVSENESKTNTVNITMLTARDGLPQSAAELMGLSANSAETPVEEQTQRTDRINKFAASVFGKHGSLAIVLGVIAIAATVAITVIIRKKKGAKKKK